MRDPASLLGDACDAMIRGEFEACQAALDLFREAWAQQPADAGARASCERQLARLRGLAAAATEGLDQARNWMRDLSSTLGGLDVYDRGGRHRVATDLSARRHRF